MEQADISIIGAGIIGLAISAFVSKEDRPVYVLERNDSFGQEASSRNSEVIHAGIYYPQDSLKAKACVEGNRLTYEICQNNKIPYKKLGKLIVACEKGEIRRLEQLLVNGQKNGVFGLKIISQAEVKNIEPEIRAQAALYSPTTGIVDSHSLMQYFLQKAKTQGAEFVFQTEVSKIKRLNGGYEVEVHDADGTDFCFFTRVLINCAGLNSDLIAESVGIDIEKEDYQLKPCKGEYLRVSSNKSRLVRHLIYPEPDENEISLGIHATPDLGEGLRLGPDAQYIKKEEINYNLDNAKRQKFCQAVNRFLPFIKLEDLASDTVGIRAKLQGPREPFRDFVICHEEQRGFPGLINLIGIDSPGLTSAPWIAKYVKDIIETVV